MSLQFWLRSLLTLLGASAPLGAQSQFEWIATPTAVPTQGDRAVAVASDASGNVHAVMVCDGPIGDSHLQVAKFDPDGKLLWSKTLDPAPGFGDEAAGIAVAANGDVCLGGTSLTIRNEIFAARFTSAGQLRWIKATTGVPDHSGARAFDMALDASDNLWIAGSVKTAPGWLDGIVQAYGPTGALLSDTRIDGPVGQHDVVTAIEIVPSGEVFATANVEGAGFVGAAIAKLGAAGDLQWLRVLDAPAGHDERLLALAGDGAGGVVVCGATTQGDFTGSLVARCDGQGSTVWVHRWAEAPNVFGATHVLVDASGVTWSLERLGVLTPRGAKMMRLSPTGALVSQEELAFFEAPVGLLAGNAGQVIALGRAPGIEASSVGPTTLALFDASGTLAWTQGFVHGPEGLLPFGMEAAPEQRIVIHGALASSIKTGEDAFVMQIDASESPHGFCTAKTDSLGCDAQTAFHGMPSSSEQQGFLVRFEQVANQKTGLFLYGIAGAASNPFGGGTLCVHAPLQRTPGLHSGGTPGFPVDCTGVFSLDMNAFAQGTLGGSPIPELLVPGTRVWMQAWGRDNGFPAPNNIALSGGLTYVVLP